MVTHDPRIENIADWILWLEDGQLRDRKLEQHSWVIDPVCGMRVDEWTTSIYSVHQGNIYVFCSERCRERFEKIKFITLINLIAMITDKRCKMYDHHYLEETPRFNYSNPDIVKLVEKQGQ